MQEMSVTEVLSDLNRDLLDQCHKYQSRDKAFVEEYGTLDIDNEIEQITPALWNSICMITRSYSERNGKQIATSEWHKKKTQAVLFALLYDVLCQ